MGLVSALDSVHESWCGVKSFKVLICPSASNKVCVNKFILKFVCMFTKNTLATICECVTLTT